MMDPPTCKQVDGEHELRVEIDILSRMDDPNLVMLISYCSNDKHRFVVYKLMPRDNLQDILKGIGGGDAEHWTSEEQKVGSMRVDQIYVQTFLCISLFAYDPDEQISFST
jgi:hypothetical protein